MRLSEIRNQIMNVLDYNPELESYKSNLDDLINMAYQRIWMMRRWTFAQKTVELAFLPDLNKERLNAILANLSSSVPHPDNIESFQVTNGSRELKLLRGSSPIYDPHYSPYTYHPYFSKNYRAFDSWQGQPVEIDGIEFKISSYYERSGSGVFILDKPWRGETKTVDDVLFKKRYYTLPADLIEILYLGHRDYPVIGSAPHEKIIQVSARQEETIGLEADRSADYADLYIHCSPETVPPGEKISGSTEEMPNGLIFIDADFPDNFYMEFAWAFRIGDKVGPLSESVVLKTGEGSDPWYFEINTLTRRGENLFAPVGNSTERYGRRKLPYEAMGKQLFFNDNIDTSTGERLGAPVWKEVTVASKVEDAGRDGPEQRDMDMPLVIPEDEYEAFVWERRQIHSGNKRYIDSSGQYQVIRPYPRIDGWDKFFPAQDPDVIENQKQAELDPMYGQYFRVGILRYYYKPLDLSADNDVPDMPYEFHQLIVYQALEDVFIKHNEYAMSEVYKRRMEDRIKELERRYVARSDELLQRGQFGIYEHWRPHTKVEVL